MSNDFQIDTTIHTGNFSNSIAEFNRAFNKANSSANKIQDGTNFEEIFNSISKDPLKGSTQFDSVNALGLKENVKSASNMQTTADSIGKTITNALGEISDINKKADYDFVTFASGGNISVHDVMISAQKSQLAMAMAIQLRNQAVNAYNEFKNMGI